MAKKKAYTCLVTGGAGFIGSQVAQALVDEGHRVVVIDDLSSGKKKYVPKEAKFIKMSVTNPKLVQTVKRIKPDYVFHLAAQIDVRKSVKDPVADAMTNIVGSLRLLDGCFQAGTTKIIFSSSGGGIYNETNPIPANEKSSEFPYSPYGISKLAFEKYLFALCRENRTDFVALRYANVYGPRQDLHGEAGVIGIFVKKMLDGETPTVNGSGRQTRDYVFVDDVVRANLLAMKKPVTGIYNIGTGVESSVNQLVKIIVRETGFAKKLKRGPAQKGEVMRSCLDISKAKKDLGWKPETDLEDGIRKTVIWFMAQR